MGNLDIKNANDALDASWMPEVYQGATAAAGGAIALGATKYLSVKEGEVKPVSYDEVANTDDTENVYSNTDDEQNQQHAGDYQDGETTNPSTEKPNTQVSTADKEGGLPGWAWALIVL